MYISRSSNIILSFILGKKVGLQGVMLASTIVELIVLIVLQIKILRLFKLPFIKIGQQAIRPALIACAFPFSIVICVFFGKIEATWISLLLWMAVFIIAWVAGTLISGLDKEGIEQLIGYLFSGKYIKKIRQY
jgi:hypothetical protein